MKKFLIKTILFLIPLAVVFAAAEYVLRSIPNAYKLKYDYMLKHGKEVETLVFGSSHTYHAVSPSAFGDKCFNLAYSSQDLERDRYLFDRFADQAKSLRNVIIDISYHTMPEMMEDFSYSESLLKYYGIYMDYPPARFSMELTIPQWSTKMLMYLKGEETCKCDSLGFGTENRNSKIDQYNAEVVVKYHTHKSRAHVERNMQTLRHIAAECEKRGIRLILLTTPVTDLYASCLDSTQLGLMYECVEEITSEYPSAVYLNYIGDSHFRHDDFFDVDHMNTSGAEKFSRILADTISVLSSGV